MTGPAKQQLKTDCAVASASVVAFMGIGRVNPTLKPTADELGAGPAQVSLLFTSYLALGRCPPVAGVGMFLSGRDLARTA